ncbi:MAG: branched-chain amino acid transporter substrate binding component [Herbinix sp.]|jgi:branched-chain amino acid transport system substrate-binding protein|nr:branched-chain amino acid transporter substrate binding component [Herbinix sp.]
MKKKLLSVFMTAMLAVTLLTGCGTKSNPSDTTEPTADSDSPAAATTAPVSSDASGTIKIGTISPNTGSLAAYGEAVVNAMILAVDEINAAGGILGQQVELDSLDDKGDSTEGANAFNKLADDSDICAVIGSVTSGVTTGLAPLADDAKIVLLSPTATADTVTETDDYVFRACYKDSYQGRMAAKFASDKGIKKVAVLYASGDAYSSGLHEAFIAAAEEFGLEIVSEESSSSVDDTEYSAQLTNIANSGAEYLFAPYYYSSVGPYIVPQARAAGFSGIIMGADGFDGTIGTMVDDKSLYNNCFFTNHYSPDDTSEVVQNFVKNYTAKFSAESLNALAALAYDSVYMLKQSIEKAGSVDRTAIRDAMSGMSFSGVTGSFTLDEAGTPEKSVAIIEFKDGAAIWNSTLSN